MENNFASNLKHLRIQNDMTQEDLGKKLNKDYSTIGKWENGTRSPVMEDVIKIAEFFNISLQELISGNVIYKNSPNTTTTELDYKQILLKKGLIDEKENITEEDAKKLIDFAIANRDYLIKKEDKKE